MKSLKSLLPSGVWCILIIVGIFGYMASVMGLDNMLNTIMHTAHDLLLNTVFYLMGMCVITGALGKVLVEFGVVDLLQRMLRPVMKPLFNMPGVASLGAVLTFLSDNPAIIALSQDKGFARYFKKYQHVSLVNFGTAFGMGLLVIIFMMGQGFVTAPLIGFAGAIFGCIVATRLMQHFTIKMYPHFKTEDAVVVEETSADGMQENISDGDAKSQDSLFIRILNSLLDGGKSGVEIGLAIIPGVLIISTFVMMLTFGKTGEGVDAMGNTIHVYTGGAYQGTELLPMLAGKINVVFDWLFGFSAPELVAFPITALGAVGAALGLIPEFLERGIIDGNAIAVCTAMGMCWSGYLSTDAATLDSLGYRSLVPRAFLSTFVGGICAGIFTHWLYVGIMFVISLFTPQPEWESKAQGWLCNQPEPVEVKITSMDDGSYVVHDWYGVKGTDLVFTVNEKDSTISITNAYANKDDHYYFVQINPKAVDNELSYALLYPKEQESEFAGRQDSGYVYCYAFLYDARKQMVDRGFYELVWGKGERQCAEIEMEIKAQIEKEKQEAAKKDSLEVNTEE